MGALARRERREDMSEIVYTDLCLDGQQGRSCLAKLRLNPLRRQHRGRAPRVRAAHSSQRVAPSACPCRLASPGSSSGPAPIGTSLSFRSRR